MARVVVADDSWLTRRVVVGILEADEHTVMQAGNGREAIELITTEAVDCILLDLLMPEVDGFGVLDYLQSNGIQIPAIVQTADIQKSTIERCMALGATAFLNKPVDESAIRSALSRALAGATGARNEAE